MTEKATMEALARLVPHGSRVLDLSCGSCAVGRSCRFTFG